MAPQLGARFVTEDQPVHEPPVVPLRDAYVILRQLAGGVRTWMRPYEEEPCQQLGATYSYSVWMRHLASLARHAGVSATPRRVAELGPGSSLGTGLAAILSGAESYIAHEVVGRPDAAREQAVLAELLGMMGRGEDIPGEDVYPRLRPKLRDYRFPSDLIDRGRVDDPELQKTLREGIDAIGAGATQAGPLGFVNGTTGLVEAAEVGSLDLLFSQAVMQYIDDLERAYAQQFELLRPGGLISHEIDFSAHETAHTWNGHWTLSDLTWRGIRGAKPYFLSRHPFSRHVRALRRASFEVVAALRSRARSNLRRRQLAPRFRWLSDDDLTVRDALLIARRPA